MLKGELLCDYLFLFGNRLTNGFLLSNISSKNLDLSHFKGQIKSFSKTHLIKKFYFCRNFQYVEKFSNR